MELGSHLKGVLPKSFPEFFRWGEATDEPRFPEEIPAREYARPTRFGFGQHALNIRHFSLCRAAQMLNVQM
jgi:hypothetical protein